MTSHQLMLTVMMMVMAVIVMTLTNQCVPMEQTAIGKNLCTHV